MLQLLSLITIHACRVQQLFAHYQIPDKSLYSLLAMILSHCVSDDCIGAMRPRGSYSNIA
jgi:hypothetical protein